MSMFTVKIETRIGRTAKASNPTVMSRSGKMVRKYVKSTRFSNRNLVLPNPEIWSETINWRMGV